MTNLLWPGDYRAGELFSDKHVFDTIVRVEKDWLAVLGEVGIAPATPAQSDDAPDSLWSIRYDDGAVMALSGEQLESPGNPVVALVELLRSRAPQPLAEWIHRGLTSQDVLDCTMVRCAADAMDRISTQLRAHIDAAASLARRHRDTPMVARTLTQHAIPSTFGMRVVGWLIDLIDAAERVDHARSLTHAQVGGAAGTLAAVTELAHGRGLKAPDIVAIRASELLAQRLNLAPAIPWHTARAPVTAIGDAMVGCTDAWGHLANDVLFGARTEVSELREPGTTRGGSSTMPNKRNPVLSTLLRRASLAAPGLAATLHRAAGDAHDDRPAGAWHVEWDTLRLLTRRTVIAAEQAGELLADLGVDTAAMHRNLTAAIGVHAEQDTMARLANAPSASDYRGATGLIIDKAVSRAEHYLEKGMP